MQAGMYLAVHFVNPLAYTKFNPKIINLLAYAP